MSLFKRRRHSVPQLNTTSTADISFMLLTFFLMTTSMDTDKGLHRQLPPMADEKEVSTVNVSRGNVINIYLDRGDSIFVDNAPVDISKLKPTIEKFIAAKHDTHIISLHADRHANYDAYFHIQNEIALAYSSLRDGYARKHYGRPLKECKPEQADEVKKYYPQRISEAEPQEDNSTDKDSEGGKR